MNCQRTYYSSNFYLQEIDHTKWKLCRANFNTITLNTKKFEENKIYFVDGSILDIDNLAFYSCNPTIKYELFYEESSEFSK
jgi:hypothetical protein